MLIDCVRFPYGHNIKLRQEAIPVFLIILTMKKINMRTFTSKNLVSSKNIPYMIKMASSTHLSLVAKMTKASINAHAVYIIKKHCS